MVEIKNIKKSIMGTIQFDLKAKGHRGFQDFVCYPMQEASEKVKVQSGKRIGYYYHETGRFQLSKSRSGGSFNPHLIFDTLVEVELSENDKIELNTRLRLTDESKGHPVVRINNAGASCVNI